eukprot:1195197-Prorocentrum_minimum.AAC.2
MIAEAHAGSPDPVTAARLPLIRLKVRPPYLPIMFFVMTTMYNRESSATSLSIIDYLGGFHPPRTTSRWVKPAQIIDNR